MLGKAILLACLLAAFGCLFYWLSKESIIQNALRRTYDSMDTAARRRIQEKRRMLLRAERRKGLWDKLERRLIYSGLTRQFPALTPEFWVVVNLGISAGVYFGAMLLGGSLWWGLGGIAAVQLSISIWISARMAANYRAVNDNLLKFLDFLGNYSVTAGEVTGICNQISRYVDEPLKSVLDECYYEAQTSGDSSLALLSMAEKIEHPRFQELVRNIEISARYAADFKTLVNDSRRAVREHLRTRQERKNLMNEAVINMLLLAGMSLVVLLMVEQLTGMSMWEILLETMVGRICLTVILCIFGLMFGQIRRLDR